MAYTINLTNGDLLTVVEDGTVDVSNTSVALIGKNFPGYGEYLNENFVHLLENFAGGTAPANQIVGQLWYDTVSTELKVWKTTGWVATSKPTIVNDTTSSGAHYITFVATSSGTPDVKVSASKGIVFTPSTGNLGLSVTAADSKLVVNNNTSTTLAVARSGTVVHVHGSNGSSPKVLIDAYGGTVSGGTYNVNNSASLTLRRGNGTSSAPEAIKNNDVIASVNVQGYISTAFAANSFVDQSSINVIATENWATGATGTKVTVMATPTGSGTAATVATFNGNGAVTITGAFSAGGAITSGGAIQAAGDITAYYSSDRNLKTNIEVIGDSLEKVAALDGITFNWNELAKDKDQNVREAGVIAQQVAEVLPEAVTTRDDGFMAVRYEKLIPLLIEAIKSLKNQVDELKNSK